MGLAVAGGDGATPGYMTTIGQVSGVGGFEVSALTATASLAWGASHSISETGPGTSLYGLKAGASLAKAEEYGGVRIGPVVIALSAGVDVGVGVEASWDARQKKLSIGGSALLSLGIDISIAD